MAANIGTWRQATTTHPAIILAELGDWRGVRTAMDSSRAPLIGLSPRMADTLLTVCLVMERRAELRFTEAADLLQVLAESVGRLMPGMIIPRGQRRGHLTFAIPRRPDGESAAWRVAAVAWREQQELGQLFREVQRARRRPQRVAVLAMREHLCCVEFDPARWGPPARSADAQRQYEDLRNVCRRRILAGATDLRRCVDEAAPDISRSVWDDAQRGWGLTWLALQALAGQTPPPWIGDHPTPVDLPPREAALAAWRHARAITGRETG